MSTTAVSRWSNVPPGLGGFLARTSGAIVYCLVLHWIYFTQVSPAYSYLGYTYREPPPHEYVWILLLVALIAALLPNRTRRPSDFVLWVLFGVAVAPSMTIPLYHQSLDDGQSVLVAVTVGAAFAASIGIARGLKFNFLPRVPLRMPHLVTLLLVYSAGVYAYIAVTSGLSLNLVSILDVYSLRDDYRDDIAASAGGLLGYLIPWQGYAINPLLITLGFLRKLPSLVALGVVGQLLLFSSTGLKSILLSAPALLIVLFIFRGGRRPSGAFLIWGAMAVAALAAIVDWVQQTDTWSQILVRRFLLTSGMLMSVYVAFFTERPKMYLSHSLLSGFVDNPYLVPYTYAVGRSVTGNPQTATNASAFADGYANAGLIGVIIAGVIVGLLLGFIDDASRGLPLTLPCALLLLPSIALSNSAVTTTFLTHGLGIAILLLALAPRDGWDSPKRPRRRLHPERHIHRAPTPRTAA